MIHRPPGLWTPDLGLPDGLRARVFLREQRSKYRHIRDPRLHRQPWQCAITVVNSSESVVTGATTNPRTFTFDIGTRTNGGLFVGYATFASLAGTVTAQTWNAVAMSKTAEVSGTILGGFESECTIGLLYLPNPSNGSNTLSVTFSYVAGTTFTTALWPLWVDGLKQTSPLDDTDSAVSATDPTITLQPTEDNTICLAVYFSDNNTPLTSDQGTQYQNEDFGPRVGGAKYLIQTTAANQTLSWSGTDAANLISAANFKAEAAGGRIFKLAGPGGGLVGPSRGLVG